MSFITINNIWQEYGDHVVLERLNLQVKEGEFCSMVGGLWLRKIHVFAPAARSGSAQPRVHYAGW